MIDELENPIHYEVWIREHLVRDIEAGFRAAFVRYCGAPEDVALNYYLNRCVTNDPEGRCQQNHKTVWCGGMSLVHFIQKVAREDNWFSLHVTMADCKANIVEFEAYSAGCYGVTDEEIDREIEEARAEGELFGREVNSYWIGDGWANGMDCADLMFHWLFWHVITKRAAGAASGIPKKDRFSGHRCHTRERCWPEIDRIADADFSTG